MTVPYQRWLDPELNKKRRRNVIIGTLVLLALFFEWAVAAYRHASETRTKCIELPSGMLLGYHSILDLRYFTRHRDDPGVYPLVGPKYADGTPLMDEHMWELFVSETSITGITLLPKWEENYGFAWREDTGLVLAHENRDAYEKIKAEMDRTNFGLGTGSRGPRIVYRQLLESGKFELVPCETRHHVWESRLPPPDEN